MEVALVNFASVNGNSGVSIEGIESCDDCFQLRQAKPKQMTLQIAASVNARAPKLARNIKAAGTNTVATIRNATVVVYPVPVDF
jgi:hypothetical protein